MKVVSSQSVGPYILGKTLGIGSNGKVQLGVHETTKERVAIKIIGKVEEPQVIQRSSTVNKMPLTQKLAREIAIMKLVDHPHVLSLKDVYESKDQLFLVLEHADGGELFDYLVSKKRLPESEAAEFFYQIMLAVEYCHRLGICHRDLKPENILLDSKRNCKIADFGMAAVQKNSMSHLKTSCGSPHYAAPEVIRGLSYDGKKADIWSCGVVLFALITGTLPFDDENIRKLLQKVKTGAFTFPKFVSSVAQDLIRKMMSVSPDDRLNIHDILNHPFLKANRPMDNSRYFVRLDHYACMKVTLLDTELLRSMRHLGWGDLQHLLRSLRSDLQTEEKLVYHLLKQRNHIKSEPTNASESKSGLTIEWSILQPRKTVEEIVFLFLLKNNVKFQLRKDGLIKCKHVSTQDMPSLKFKIDISSSNRNQTWTKLTHQQGCQEEFKSLSKDLFPFVMSASLTQPSTVPQQKSLVDGAAICGFRGLADEVKIG